MQGAWSRFKRRRGALVALALLALMVACAIFAGVLSPADPTEQFREQLMQAPSWHWSQFPLGTDELGRDVLSRLLHGTRLTLGIASLAVLAAAIPGVIAGLISAFYPNGLGLAILRVADILLALPTVLLAIAIVATLGPGVINTIIAVAVGSFPSYVRLMRASALSEISKPYFTATRAIGASRLRQMFVSVLPNCLGPVIVNATLDFSNAILVTAGLGFLGLGAQPPAPEWGTMLANARDFLGRADWLVVTPGIAILVAVVCVNIVGDALGEAVDPRRK
ncbi:ABC transporter permease subunit [soil metagenome]